MHKEKVLQNFLILMLVICYVNFKLNSQKVNYFLVSRGIDHTFDKSAEIMF